MGTLGSGKARVLEAGSQAGIQILNSWATLGPAAPSKPFTLSRCCSQDVGRQARGTPDR